MELKIAKYDTPDVTAMETAGTLQAYLDDEVNYSTVIFKESLKPSNGWAMPYVTNHKYRIHWAEGLDFTRMRMEVSERWKDTDFNTFFQTNFTDTREAINVTVGYWSTADQIANRTLL